MLAGAIVQELCESRGGRPGLSVLTSLLVSVDVKLYWTMLRHWSQLVPNMSTDIWGHYATLPTYLPTYLGRGSFCMLGPVMSSLLTARHFTVQGSLFLIFWLVNQSKFYCTVMYLFTVAYFRQGLHWKLDTRSLWSRARTTVYVDGLPVSYSGFLAWDILFIGMVKI